MNAPTDSRLVAYEVLRRTFEGGAYADRAFRAAADRAGLDARDRAFAQHLAYGSVQRRGTTDVLIERLAERDPSGLDPEVLAALRLGLFELLFADAVPDHAAVGQAVELAKRAGAGRGAGFVNALLRRAAGERELLMAGADDSEPESAAFVHSAPPWLARLWWEELGPEMARSLLAAANEPAEITFRLNPRRAEPAAAGSQWPLDGAEAIPGGAEAIAARFAAGELTPQSRGSAAVVAVLDPKPGERLLDLCAGPGIKATAIGERLAGRGEVVAIELHSGRAAEISANAERLGLSGIEVLVADAIEIDGLEGFDRVLIDAPCSDLGALASRPDARWRKSPEAIAELAILQRRLLEVGSKALKPGGVLVYSTCTISLRENENLIRAFAEANRADLEVSDLGAVAPALASGHDARFLQIRSDRDRTTGFFIARLTRHD